MRNKIIKISIVLLIAVLLLIFAQPIWVKIENKVPTRIESHLNHFFGRKSLLERRAKKAEVSVSILEGKNLSETINAFAEKGLSSADEFYRFSGKPKIDYRLKDSLVWPKDYSDRFDFLKDKPKYYSLEGYLFPDTYRFFSDVSADEIIVKMLENFDRKLTKKMKEDIAAQGRSIFEIITMASIIEKEAPINYGTGDNNDARIISGIFWRRLKNGQALQSCATLAYVLGENKAQYSEADTKVDSPFNTYAYRGLPPAPIANPGILAIEAAIYPVDTSYNYFLTPAGTKKIVFSSTYEEHLINKKKYLD
ncbi:MAG: endolytic transglycosylase MltG [Candidatus Falkowbacteria bacterium]|nr:endolytic transglycosylase MltG [Candidatus Falkowbacteria bacterium]